MSTENESIVDEVNATAEELIQKATREADLAWYVFFAPRRWKESKLQSSRAYLAEADKLISSLEVRNSALKKESDISDSPGTEQVNQEILDEIEALRNVASAQYESGHFHEAIDTLNEISATYITLGQLDKAVEYYGKVTGIAVEFGLASPGNIAVTLNKIGTAYADLGRWREAYDFFGVAAELEESARQREGADIMHKTIADMLELHDILRTQQDADKEPLDEDRDTTGSES